MELQYKRPDGTFVALVNNRPYHIIEDDPLYEEALEQADELGEDLKFEPAPEPFILPPKTKLYKADIWKKRTETEYGAIQAVISSLSPRIQGIFRDANYISINDGLYPLVLTGATQAVGATRAAELLEPTDF